MPFAPRLHESLRHRESQIALEFAAGESLETVLGRHLLAVESTTDTALLTSVLLLDRDGTRLWHGAAPSLPPGFYEAIDGVEIGPGVGSCGRAAFIGQAVYVTDVATDPLWKDFRELALEHGLRACWSTPIRNAEGSLIGTFAIYHPTPRSPTPDEVEAIRLITGHVAQAIEWARVNSSRARPSPGNDGKPYLRLVPTASSAPEASSHRSNGALLAFLHSQAAKCDRHAEIAETQELSQALKAVARDCRNLIAVVRQRKNVDDNDA